MSRNLDDFSNRMKSSVDSLCRDFSGLRTGRASVTLLDSIKIDSYGNLSPLNQVGSVTVSDPRMLTVQVWDRSLVKAVEKAIRDAGLGLNPAADGQIVRVPLPPLTEERRSELGKIAAKYGEEARVSVRNIRRDALDIFKKSQKDGDISEDELARLSKDIQSLTDEYIKKIDDLLTAKQKDIMSV